MKKVLFLNLTTFSETGGLEKFNKCFLKALAEIESDTGIVSESYSMYDSTVDEKYYSAKKYRGFRKNKVQFVLAAVLRGIKSDVIILGHINLAMVGCIIRFLAPSKKIVLICHGIDVWGQLSSVKKKLINAADKILAVSNYTKQRIVDLHKVLADKITVFHNTIDPYFYVPQSFVKDEKLLNRYGLAKDDFLLYTLCRLSSTEQYKGYDYVIKALHSLQNKYPNIKYMIAGKYDDAELARLRAMINELELNGKVLFTGYIQNEELVQHYQLGDVYIMPSRGEGFGIAFIEAMISGSRVIAGNTDGSVDALANGELGVLVNPTNVEDIVAAIEYSYSAGVNKKHSHVEIQENVTRHFGFEVYKNRLKQLIPTI